MKSNYPILYNIVKYILIVILVFSFINFLLIIFNILIILFGIIKFNLLSKLSLIKNFLESKYNDRFKNPKNPKKVLFLDVFSDWRKKRKLAKIRKQVLNKQSYNYANNISQRNGNNNMGGISRNS
jgi:biopolymer transport protein ExbB/TolQ